MASFIGLLSGSGEGDEVVSEAGNWRIWDCDNTNCRDVWRRGYDTENMKL